MTVSSSPRSRSPLRLALEQFHPEKARPESNLERIRERLTEHREESDLVVFPEAALSGYFLEGGVAESARTAEEVALGLGAAPPGAPDVVVGFYERWRRRLYNAVGYFEVDGEGGYRPAHVHRKLFLPTYGVFDEDRFLETGRSVRPVDTRFGRIGILVCEDFWHSLPATILALSGAELIVVASASPARDFRPGGAAWPGGSEADARGGRAAASEDDAGGGWPAASEDDAGGGRPAGGQPANLARWSRLASGTAEEHGVFVAVSQLVGSEGGKLFPGGSMVVGPEGELISRGPLLDEGTVRATLDGVSIERVRARTPLLADLEQMLPHLQHSLERSTRSGRWRGRRGHGHRRGGAGGDFAGLRGSGEAGEPSPIVSTDPAVLDLDLDLVETALVRFIQDEVQRRRGFERVVIGVSGGVDSAVSLFLACRALGPENVFGFRLPYATSSADSLAHAELALEATGAHARTIEITGPVDAYLDAFEAEADGRRRGNVMARTRAVILFDQSAGLRALPLGTGNKSERLLGYYTWHADDSPPINPLGDLLKTQVWALARHLGVPEEIISKPASADLIQGVHDEHELGIGYPEADPILHWLVQGYTVDDLVRSGFDEGQVDLVHRRLSSTHWKRELPTVAMLSSSAIGAFYLRPVDY
ncbi:NAD+ synthase [Gaopeijia maritima]|uniref:NAD+ synthase n=1 Tax=Gaopeijia maritima TaxID=3119007 RepID=UPI00324C193D